METRELDYDLPAELIAQHPAERRDASRLLVYDRASGEVQHRVFRELPGLVDGPHRRQRHARRAGADPDRAPARGGAAARGARRRGVGGARAPDAATSRPGERHGPVELVEHLGEGRWRVRLHGEPAGATPLPPYITAPLDDPERYQTVYARERGLGRGADGRAALHSRRCSRGSTSSA